MFLNYLRNIFLNVTKKMLNIFNTRQQHINNSFDHLIHLVILVLYPPNYLGYSYHHN